MTITSRPSNRKAQLEKEQVRPDSPEFLAFEGLHHILHQQLYYMSPVGSVFSLVSFYLQITRAADTTPSNREAWFKKEQ